MDGQWLEVRSTIDILDNYPILMEHPPGDAEASEAAFSIVVEPDSTKKRRKLPSLYVATYQVFAHRDVVEVLKRFLRTIDAVALAVTSPVYAAHACAVGDKRGLYGRDFFSRDPFRRRLMRRGMSFAKDPYVRLLPDGSFACLDWGTFNPDFIVLPHVDHDDDRAIVEVKGAPLLFSALGLRLGRAGADELYLLRHVTEHLKAIGSASAGALVDELKMTV